MRKGSPTSGNTSKGLSMKRFWIVLMAVAVAMVVAVPVNAAKPCDSNPAHPSCNSGDDEPTDLLAGTTCNPLWWDTDFKDKDFTVVLTADNSDACIDVIPPAAGRWWVTVTATGQISRNPSLLLVPRDAVGPGDSCGGVSLRRDVIFDPIPLPYFEDLNGNREQDLGEEGDPRFTVIPEATVNACLGNADPGSLYQGDFAELVEREGQLDEIVLGPTEEVHPLAFQIFAGGLRGTGTLTVSVDLPEPPPQP